MGIMLHVSLSSLIFQFHYSVWEGVLMNLNEVTFNHKEYFQVYKKYNSNSYQSYTVNKQTNKKALIYLFHWHIHL